MSSIHAEVAGRSALVFFFGAIILIAAYLFDSQSGILPNSITSPGNTIGVYYNVTKVTDGDTIHLDIDGTDTVIRLIGINTPETVDPRRPVQCFGKEASARMKSLVGGKIVRLEYDDSQGMHDIYNRLLAYVYLEDGEMVNRKMIAEGYAFEYTYMTPYAYQSEFRGLQTLARTSKRGLWAEDTCNGTTATTQ